MLFLYYAALALEFISALVALYLGMFCAAGVFALYTLIVVYAIVVYNRRKNQAKRFA